MDLHTLLLVLAGLAAPAINSVLNQPAWSARVTWVVSALTAAGLGTAATALSDGLSASELVTAITAVFTVGQALYHLVYRHTGLAAFLEQLAVFRPDPVELEVLEGEPAEHASEGPADYSELPPEE